MQRAPREEGPQALPSPSSGGGGGGGEERALEEPAPKRARLNETSAQPPAPAPARRLPSIALRRRAAAAAAAAAAASAGEAPAAAAATAPSLAPPPPPPPSSSSSSGTTFDDLPVELRVRVLSFVSAADLYNVAQTCRTLRRDAADPPLWRRLTLARWPGRALRAPGSPQKNATEAAAVVAASQAAKADGDLWGEEDAETMLLPWRERYAALDAREQAAAAAEAAAASFVAGGFFIEASRAKRHVSLGAGGGSPTRGSGPSGPTVAERVEQWRRARGFGIAATTQQPQRQQGAAPPAPSPPTLQQSPPTMMMSPSPPHGSPQHHYPHTYECVAPSVYCCTATGETHVCRAVAAASAAAVASTSAAPSSGHALPPARRGAGACNLAVLDRASGLLVCPVSGRVFDVFVSQHEEDEEEEAAAASRAGLLASSGARWCDLSKEERDEREAAVAQGRAAQEEAGGGLARSFLAGYFAAAGDEDEEGVLLRR